ncbi:hypothetical protein [Ekhidna sp.]
MFGPGLLHYTENNLPGMMAIHADWPIYPPGMGWKLALTTMANFPNGTSFYQIDDIDKCILFVDSDPGNLTDVYDYKNYHLAMWHEDLIELQEMSLIEGVRAISDFEFSMIKFKEIEKVFGPHNKYDRDGNLLLPLKNTEGELAESTYSRPIKHEDDEHHKTFAKVESTVSITPEGFRKVYEIVQELKFHEEIESLVMPFIEIKKYDAAVREASLFLESSIRKLHQTHLYGQRLIEFHIRDVIVKNRENFSSAIKNYRGELRTVFKFIRNDFAHNFKILTEDQCKSIVVRISNVYSEFKEVVHVYFDEKIED